MPQFNVRNFPESAKDFIRSYQATTGLTQIQIVLLALDRLKTQATIEDILTCAAQLPAGLPDPKASAKLIKEIAEFEADLQAGDDTGALTELADIIYYCLKVIHWACWRVGVSFSVGLAVSLAKYTLRARPGNPKDDPTERRACHNAKVAP